MQHSMTNYRSQNKLPVHGGKVYESNAELYIWAIYASRSDEKAVSYVVIRRLRNAHVRMFSWNYR